MTLIQSKQPLQSFPNYEATEDFLDFSRWRMPADERVLKKRLGENLKKRFTGNYFCVYVILTSIYAILYNWKIVAAATTVTIGGLIARHLYFYIHFYEGLEKRKRRHSSSLSDTSATSYGSIAVIFVLYKFSVIIPLVIIGIFSFCLIYIHASFRPFDGEHAYLLRQTKYPSL